MIIKLYFQKDSKWIGPHSKKISFPIPGWPKKKSVGREGFFFFLIAYSFCNLYRNSKVDITGSWQNDFFIQYDYFQFKRWISANVINFSLMIYTTLRCQIKGGGWGLNKKRWLDNYEKLIKGVVLKKEGGQVLIKGCPVHIKY